MRILLILAVSMFFSMSSQAADGSSGCGPGWYVFKKNSLISSSLRSTTNGVLGVVVTFGMTFGTSNCAKHSIVKKEKESLHYVTMNYHELKSEIAKGGGEFLTSFSHTVGCPASANTALQQGLQKNYQKLFKSSKVSPEDTLLEVYNTIFTNQELTNKCVLGLS